MITLNVNGEFFSQDIKWLDGLKPHTHTHKLYTGCKILNGERTVSSKTDVGKTILFTCRRVKLDPHLRLLKKN